MSEKKEPLFKVVTSRQLAEEQEEREKQGITEEPEPVEEPVVFNENITDDEISRVLEEGAAQNKRGKLLVTAGIIMALSSFVTTSMFKIVLLIGGVIVVAFGLGMKYKASQDVKMDAGIHIIHKAMNEVFESVNYQPKKGLDASEVNVEMGFPFYYNEMGSDDLIEGIYHGMKIRMADVKLNNVTTSTDEDGDEHEHTEKVFQGLWMICDFGKELSADLTITEGTHTKKNRIKTDNDRFNKKFGVYSLNPHDVFYILTPHVMEYILEMDKKSNGDTYMHFSRDGKLNIAINTGHAAFEIDSFKMTAEEMRTKFITEVGYVTALLDELTHVDTMYKN